MRTVVCGKSREFQNNQQPNGRSLGCCSMTSFYGCPVLILAPESIAFVPSLLASLMLLMDLFHMIGLFLNRGFQPQATLLCRPVTSRAIGSGLRVIVPGRVCHQRAALDPVHVVIGRRDEVCFINYTFHPAEVGAEMKQVRRFQLAGMTHPADRGGTILLQRLGADPA